MRLLALVLPIALLAACNSADLLPGGDAPQRAIQSGVVQILGLRNAFEGYTKLYQEFRAAEARGDKAAAEHLQAAIAVVLEDAQKSRVAYRELVASTARQFAADSLSAGFDAVVARYTDDGALPLIPPARQFAAQVLAYQKDGARDFDRWFAEILR